MSRFGRLGLMLALGLATCGCSQDADRMARVCQKTAAKFDGVTENMRGKLQNGWGAVRGSVSETSLDSRVALRLRWDADMTGGDVQERSAEWAGHDLAAVIASRGIKTVLEVRGGSPQDPWYRQEVAVCRARGVTGRRILFGKSTFGVTAGRIAKE